MGKKKLKVIKIGGNIIDDQMKLKDFLKSFAKLKGPKILVHGGGKLASKMAKKMNVPVEMIEGRRVTNAETLDIITMVYAGKINKNIVAQLQANNCNTIGFSGADGNTIIAKKRPVNEIDYGFVGDIVKVEVSVIKLLLINNLSILFCAISHDRKGQLFNTNADTIASELAIALSKDFEVELYYCFEKNGVLKDIHDDSSVIEKIDQKNYITFKEQGIISDGMIPKLDNCFYALEKKVKKICIGKPEMLFDKNIKFTKIHK
ncbi:acetylglutamate kinase [Pseudotenacibaculum sp. MALMAid0570]|uniref:acetylglutamate kinase n=1 Tax=Pseudotenacibaculum sp. MALMAid0570 TaxID=3143938 RepID=UPI0032DEE823